jgi:hypothetical protein
MPVSLHPVLPPLPKSPSHELTPPPLSSPAAAPPNPSEANKTKPEATEAKPESHRGQEHANTSRMDHSNAAEARKLQQAQVHDSYRRSSNSNIIDKTIYSKDDSTDNSEHSTHDDSLSPNSPNSDTGNCYL